MKVVKNAPAYQQAYQLIREEILQGKYKPGDRLIETEISEALGISRTPVREAIRMLINERLVIPLRTGGVMVYKPSLQEIMEIHQCRRGLESVAASLAAQRMTSDEVNSLLEILEKTEEALAEGNLDLVLELNVRFHDSIVEGSKNRRLIEITSALRAPLFQYRMANLHLYKSRQFLDEHWEIARSIRDRDPVRAEESMKKHIASDEQADVESMRVSDGNVGEAGEEEA